jgi:barstar (barnase inhibitor)
VTALRDAISGVYAQLDAPGWAAANLDALADVLRDLSWLPDGPIDVRVPARAGLDVEDSARLERVLRRAAAESADGPHPIRLIAEGERD